MEEEGFHSGHHCDTTNGTIRIMNLSFFDSIEETIISLHTDGRNCSGINFLIALNSLEKRLYAFNIPTGIRIFRISWVSIPDEIIHNLNYKVNRRRTVREITERPTMTPPFLTSRLASEK